MTQTNLLTKQRLTDLENKLMVAGAGEGRGGGIVREFGMDVYTLLYLKWITNKDLLSCTGNSAQCHVAAWMGGRLGGEWKHVYVWPSPFAVHQKLSQHCYLALPQYKIKSFFFF